MTGSAVIVSRASSVHDLCEKHWLQYEESERVLHV